MFVTHYILTIHHLFFFLSGFTHLHLSAHCISSPRCSSRFLEHRSAAVLDFIRLEFYLSAFSLTAVFSAASSLHHWVPACTCWALGSRGRNRFCFSFSCLHVTPAVLCSLHLGFSHLHSAFSGSHLHCTVSCTCCLRWFYIYRFSGWNYLTSFLCILSPLFTTSLSYFLPFSLFSASTAPRFHVRFFTTDFSLPLLPLPFHLLVTPLLCTFMHFSLPVRFLSMQDAPLCVHWISLLPVLLSLGGTLFLTASLLLSSHVLSLTSLSSHTL